MESEEKEGEQKEGQDGQEESSLERRSYMRSDSEWRSDIYEEKEIFMNLYFQYG